MKKKKKKFSFAKHLVLSHLFLAVQSLKVCVVPFDTLEGGVTTQKQQVWQANLSMSSVVRRHLHFLLTTIQATQLSSRFGKTAFPSLDSYWGHTRTSPAQAHTCVGRDVLREGA